MEHFTLSNGLRALIVPKDDESVTVAMMGLAGSGYEEKAGASHFLEHLLFDGSTNYPGIKQLNQIVDDLGCRKNGSTNKQTVHYFVKSLPEALEQSFVFLSEMLLRPLLSEEDVTREKTIIEQEVNRFKDDPGMYVERKIYSLIYPGNPLGRFVTGDVDEVMALNRQDLTENWKTHYTARNFVMVVAGNVSSNQAKALTEKYFNEMPEGSLNPTLDVMPHEPRKLYVENRENMKQAHFLISFPGYKLTDDNIYSSSVLMRLLTGGFSSRLYRRLRAERAMIYSLRGWSRNLSFGGSNIITTAVDENRLNEALAIINEEIQKVVNEPIENDELSRAINIASSMELFGLESNENLAVNYAGELLIRGRIRTPQETKEGYSSVTKSDIQRVAQETLAKPPKIIVLSKSLTEDEVVAL